jgi:DNA-binding NtrC family response regulator
VASVLIVDPEKSTRLALARELRRDGDRVETLADAEEACDALESGPFDLLVVDVSARSGSAVAIVARLRVATDALLVVCSSAPTVEEAVEMMRLGASSYVRKPVACGELRRLLPNESRSPTGAEIELATLESLERRQILATLDRVGWNRRRAAGILQISTTTLWRRLKAFGVDPPPVVRPAAPPRLESR